MKEYNIKDNISSGIVCLTHYPSHDSFSDVLIKCLPEDAHLRHSMIGVTLTTCPPLPHFKTDSTDLCFLDVSTSSQQQGESEDVTG